MTISEKTKYVDLKGKYKSKYQHLIDKLENPKWQLKIGNITNVENESFETVIKNMIHLIHYSMLTHHTIRWKTIIQKSLVEINTYNWPMN